MRFASLGSGSQGNALVVDSGGTRVMLDCGFSARQAEVRLARLALVPCDMDGILVTHEHSDHIAGVFRFARRHSIPVYLTHGTYSACQSGDMADVSIKLIDSHSSFSIGGLEIHPFPVPHDAREPAQFVFSDGRWRLGVLTDAGSLTPHMVSMLDACDALVLECNHDRGMLANSDYPDSLKRRILGDFGHLDNDQAAALLGMLNAGRLQHIVAAHLSEQNNAPVLATTALSAVLGCTPEWIGVACQHEGFGWREMV